jgi:Protein of unknown function (DUF3237)
MKKIICVFFGLIFAAASALAADTGGFEPAKPSLELLARFTVDLVAPVWELGKTSEAGRRRIIPITGGKFTGPKIKGEIQNNGADWQVVTPEGMAIIDTRYLLKTDDGALIYIQTKGMRHGPAEVIAAIGKGEIVDPAKYYFRVNVTFETSASKYEWMNRTMAVGSAMRLGNAVVMDVYAVK